MGNRYFLRKYGTLSILLILLFGWVPHTFAAQPFMVEKQIDIETRYSEKARDVMGPVINWHLSPEVLENGYAIQYYIDGKELFCTLTVDTSRSMIAVTLSGSTDKILDKTSGAYIPFVGFPAPCRIFTMNDFSQPGSFKMLREAGNRRFSNEFFFEIKPISLEEALINGWLDSGIFDDEKDPELVMVTIKNKADQVIFMQLWEKDTSWWLYEETDDSKSWKRN